MSEVDNDTKSAKNRRPWWIRVLKITGFTIVGLILIILAALTAVVWILTPERLTPIVEQIASDNLRAKVSIERVELTFWSTFPDFEVDVRRVNLISESLVGLDDSIKAVLPTWADSLASIRRFHGSINVPMLMTGCIALNDITIERPEFNLLQATDKYSNFDIFPPSESSEEDGGGLPDFSFGTFSIRDGMPVRFVSLPDSTDLALKISEVEIQGKSTPVYRLAVDGKSHAQVADFRFENLRFGIDGDIRWDHVHPQSVSLDGFRVGVGPVEISVDTEVDFTEEPVINSLTVRLEPLMLDSLLAVVPEPIVGDIGQIGGTVLLGGEVVLTKPYRPGIFPGIPSAKINLNLGEGNFNYERLNLKKLSLTASAKIDGDAPDCSVLEIADLFAVGEGVGFRLNATVCDPLSDPHITGHFKGGILAKWLPARLLARLPFDIQGHLTADCNFELRQSWLNRENFHRIRFNGNAELSDFDFSMRDASARIAITAATLKLGTNSTIRIGEHQADSLLTASLEIDSMSFFTPGLEVQGKQWKLGLGSLNRSDTKDTTQINPIGGRIIAGMLSLKNSADSMKLRLRDATVSGSLTRYQGDVRKPNLHLKVSTRRAVYSDNIVRAFISDADANFNLHPSSPRIGRRMRARMDSIHEANPTLPVDSVYARALAMRRSSDVNSDALPNAFDLDDSTVQLLKKWNVSGGLKATRVAAFTPYFPIRNSISELDMAFSSDSLIIRDTHLKVGRSDLTIAGRISNISRSLTSRRGSPLKIDLSLQGDTVDINRIAAAMFAGAAYGERMSDFAETAAMTDDSERQMQLMVDNLGSNDTVTAIVIPMNIDAELKLDFKNVLYSDLLLHDLGGKLMVYDGSANLRGLSARTDIGSVSLNALYTAADRDDLKFAFGLELKDFRIARFIKLMPSIDSIMPLLNDISGIINADIAATSELTPTMDINIPTLSAAIKLTGDSLVLLDNETFRTVSKWLLFKNKQRNLIDRMNVELVVDNSRVELFPFIFDIDRYKLGVMGHNDLAMNFNYHVAVLKSPLPFKFGINLSGNPDKMKVRLGGAKFNEKNVGKSITIADTTRINLVRQIENSFVRGLRNSGIGRLKFNTSAPEIPDSEVSLTPADSAMFIREGLIEAPTPNPVVTDSINSKKEKKRNDSHSTLYK